MKRLSTTVLAVVGIEAEACLQSLAGAANVAVAEAPSDEPALVRAQEAWRRTVRSHARFTICDADPLQTVGEAWAAEFEGAERGRLDVEVSEVLTRWRADSLGMPDYYLVLEPENLPEAHKNWYLGVLHRAAPHRVVPVEADGATVRAAIRTLRAGRWWPDLPTLLGDLPLSLPDQLMVGTPAASFDPAVSDRLDPTA